MHKMKSIFGPVVTKKNLYSECSEDIPGEFFCTRGGGSRQRRRLPIDAITLKPVSAPAYKDPVTKRSLTLKTLREWVNAELETLHDEFVNKEMPVEGKELVLREGCRYMLLANTDLEGGAFRGAVGTVVGVKAGTSGEVEDVHLKLDSQPPEAKPHVLHRRTEVLDGPSGGRCRVSFFPLGYGYAGTYDSVQGKTLEKVVCAVTPRMPAGMLYVGISRVRRAENVYIVPNVNSFNSCTDAERILLSNPGITRVDKKVARFAKELHALSCFMKYDPDVFAELKASTTQVPLPETGPPLCRMCGAAADTLAVPCGHLCACATCWDDAVLNHGLRTCFGCVRLVTGKMSVKTL